MTPPAKASTESNNPERDRGPNDAAPATRDGNYTVVARRYRPQTFDELIGQQHVARALTGAIATNRVGHAYLFTGARGVGKTSAARILAKALECVHGPTPTPCNQCDICESINAGSDVDVLEIDGASNRGIDEIRQLRQNVNIRPSRARYKIYIIDEVHMLTREAFNALLKTLEEPPEHVKFIFCTTEAAKIPITILSRCQRFDFAGIRSLSIAERLKQIVDAEGVAAESDALALLARRANGSMRDSQSLLEQLLSLGQKKITVAEVHAMLGTAGEQRIGALLRHLVDRNAAAALGELDAAVSEGVDVGQLLEQLLGTLRDCMAAAAGCDPDSFLFSSADQQQVIVETGQRLGLETVLAMIQILDQSLSRLRYSSQGRTIAEMAIVRIASLENLEELSGVIAQLRGGAGPDPASRPPATNKSSDVAAAKKKGDAQTAVNAPQARRTLVDPEPAGRAAAPTSSHDAQAIWQQTLAKLSDMLSEFASRAEQIALVAPDRLAASFASKYNSCKLFCERTDQLREIEASVSAVVGRPMKVDLLVTADDGPAPAVERSSPAAIERQRLAEKAAHPMIRRAAELFQAQITRVEEPGTY